MTKKTQTATPTNDKPHVEVDTIRHTATLFPGQVNELRISSSSDKVTLREDELYEICQLADAGQALANPYAVPLGRQALELIATEASKQARALRARDKSIPKLSSKDYLDLAAEFVFTYKKGVSDEPKWERVIRRWLKSR